MTTAAAKCEVSIHQGHVDIRFIIPSIEVDMKKANILRQFISDLFNRKFVGLKLTPHTAGRIQEAADVYTPLIYLLIELDVYHGHT